MAAAATAAARLPATWGGEGTWGTRAAREVGPTPAYPLPAVEAAVARARAEDWLGAAAAATACCCKIWFTAACCSNWPAVGAGRTVAEGTVLAKWGAPLPPGPRDCRAAVMWGGRTPVAPAMTLLRGTKTGPSPARCSTLFRRWVCLCC